MRDMRLLAVINHKANREGSVGKLAGGRVVREIDQNPPCVCGHRESFHQLNEVGDAYQCAACWPAGLGGVRVRKLEGGEVCCDFELKKIQREDEYEETRIEREEIEGAKFEGEAKLWWDAGRKEIVVKSGGAEFMRRGVVGRGEYQRAFTECWECAEWLARKPRFTAVRGIKVKEIRLKEIQSYMLASQMIGG